MLPIRSRGPSYSGPTMSPPAYPMAHLLVQGPTYSIPHLSPISPPAYTPSCSQCSPDGEGPC